MSTTIESTNETNNGWPNYSYEATLEASDKINWRVEDLIGGDKRLDFTKHSFRNRSRAAMPWISSHPRNASSSIRFEDMVISTRLDSSKSSFCRSCWIMHDRCCAATMPAFGRS